MAKIERITRVENNLFDFDELLSFQTRSYVGEWDENADGYIIFDKTSKHASEIVVIIYADSLEELIYKVKKELYEEIVEVYNKRITNITFDV